MKATYMLGLLLSAGGCATSPIAAWQSALEDYVDEQGNGDLNVLRSVDRSPSESDFALIGARRGGLPLVMPRRTDANGVLLAYRSFAGRGWYVYLVGTVEYRGALVDFPVDDARVTDIRLAAVSGDGQSFSWLVGAADPDAVELYCRPQLERWRRSDPSRAEADTAPTRFPTPADDFQLDVAPEALTAVDEHSRAAWRLSLQPE